MWQNRQVMQRVLSAAGGSFGHVARLLAVVGLLSLGGCGFHLRGLQSAELPARLSALRVTMGGGAAYPPMLVEMRDALRTETGTRLINNPAARVPTLSLWGENIGSEVAAIDVTGRATEYLLDYEVSFSLTDAAGRQIIPARTIKIQRQYSFNKLNVLATGRETGFLQDDMRRDAVRQIIRQLVAVGAGQGSGHAH
ncbi:MAG: LPS-assembly lipoprotein LptE [Acidiferrobacterales bacterium]